MSDITVARNRTSWDVIVGILLVVLSFIVLGNAFIATVVSVLFLGWMILISGLTLIIAAFFRIWSGGFWSAALGGGILSVLGLVLLRNTAAAVVTLTLVAGALIFAEGLVRVMSAFQNTSPADRWALVLSGLISIGLGLFVLLNLVTASFTFLGIILGVQTLLEGLTLIAVGRVRVVTPAVAATADQPSTGAAPTA